MSYVNSNILKKKIVCLQCILKRVFFVHLVQHKHFREQQMEYFPFPSFDQQYLLWWHSSKVQEVPTFHSCEDPGGMMETEEDMEKRSVERGKKTCWEKGNLPWAEAECLEGVSR